MQIWGAVGASQEGSLHPHRGLRSPALKGYGLPYGTLRRFLNDNLFSAWEGRTCVEHSRLTCQILELNCLALKLTGLNGCILVGDR